MSEWRKKHGDIVSINSFGKPIIFVYSEKIARDILDKHGATSSDRPEFVMNTLVGWDYALTFFPYTGRWRRHRRALNQYFHASRSVTTALEQAQSRSLRLLFQDLLETPAEFLEHIKFYISSIMIETTYAIQVKREDDTLVKDVHIALEGLGHTLLPGTWLVDIFPILKNIPDWIPGLPANKLIKKYRIGTQHVADIPFSIAKNQPTPNYSYVSFSLERLRDLHNSSGGPLQSDEETVIKNSAGISFAAGSGTLFPLFLQAIMAALLYPDVQKKMQSELDRVLGDRLPTLKDRVDLPYVSAFCAEAMRWRPSIPLGIPHATSEDGIYGEYFIPKGSIIVTDLWQILRGDKYGPNPDEFNPERFLQPGVIPPMEQFGFGRRICAGRFLSVNAIFLFTASIFKVFDFMPAKDENGADVPISDEITVSSLPAPLPFKCSITPRSSLSEFILREE